MRTIPPAYQSLAYACLGVVVGTNYYYWVVVVPKAIRRWADVQGFAILSRKCSRWQQFLAWSVNKPKWSYRIMVVDKAGLQREAVVTVGRDRFYSMTVESCPIEVRWIEVTPNADGTEQARDEALWDKDLDRSA